MYEVVPTRAKEYKTLKHNKIMTILELQKALQEMYEKYGDVEVAIQNGDDGGDYFGWRDAVNVEVEGEYPNEIVILS